MMTTSRLALALVAALSLTACPGAQQKESSGNVEVKLRRVDVDLTRAGFDTVDLLIVAIVENGTSSDLQVTGGDAQLMLAGKAEHLEDETDDGEGEDEAADDEEEATGEVASLDEDDDGDEGEDDEDDADTTGIVTGDWVKGTAPSGTATAFQTTEVPIRVTLPLPTDPDALERLMSWGRMSLDVKGQLTIAGKPNTFGGEREVATPTLPKPILEEAQVASVDEGEKGVAYFRVGIDNPNVFDIKVDEFAWGVTVGGKEMRKLGKSRWENVPASSIASFEDSVNLTTESYGPEVKKLLRETSVPYVVEGKMTVKGIEREFRFEGDMEFAR